MKKILLVDDEPDLTRVLKMRLESLGYQVVTASNGKEALGMLKSGNPDLIVTDVLMPVMDGFQFYKELKNNLETAKVPVLVLTGRGKMEDTFRVIGVDDFISKPFETADFLAQVAKLLNKSSAVLVAPAVKVSSAEILILGTDSGVLRRMQELLNGAGHGAEFFSSGSALISAAKVSKPKLILMDVLMMDIPAYEIVVTLRSLEGFKKIPLVMYSHLHYEAGEDVGEKMLSIESAKDSCLEAGATEHMGQFNEKTFSQRLAKYL